MENGRDIGAVGDKLVALAMSDPTDPTKSLSDAYVRTAFNRYYYASFLVVQHMLGEIKSEWARTRHKDIPLILRESLISAAKGLIRNKTSSSIVHDKNVLNNSFFTLRSAGNALAQEIEHAYNIRVIADYRPDSNVQQKGWESTIDGVALRDAQEWRPSAVQKAEEILNAWQEISPV